jgi:hypothetical protein
LFLNLNKNNIFANPLLIMHYHTGDIFHCSGNKPISRIIKKLTQSKFSHSAVFIEIWGQGYIMDSQSKGTHLIPFDVWEKKWNYTFDVHRSPTLESDLNRRAFSIRALSKAGHTGYDFVSLIIRHPIYLLTGQWHEQESKKHNKMYCSEFVAWTHNISSSYRMSPQDLYDFCIKNNFSKVEHEYAAQKSLPDS